MNPDLVALLTMTKIRKSIPKGTREKVLKEYKHRCAICGGEDPELHHIDEDPSNNDPLNLIPLCPNNHTKQHNPVSAIESGRLRLFRIYKHPYILKPQFHPLFMRLRFLYKLEENPSNLGAKAQELIDLVETHEKGGFYGKQIAKLIKQPPMIFAVTSADTPAMKARRDKSLADQYQNYKKRVMANRTKVVELIVEMLWYQRWETTNPDVPVQR